MDTFFYVRFVLVVWLWWGDPAKTLYIGSGHSGASTSLPDCPSWLHSGVGAAEEDSSGKQLATSVLELNRTGYSVHRSVI